MKILLYFTIILLLVSLAFEGCEQPINPVSEGFLTFSTDTVKFDSIFINFLTPSERVSVYNRNNKDMQIDRIWLEGGENSEFSLIVDGISGQEVTDVVLADDDSVRIFVNLTSDLRDEFAEDYILFQVGENIQRLLVRAFVVDAFYFRSRLQLYSLNPECQVDSLELSGYFFSRDTVLTPEKPIIFDGPILIPPGVTVTIQPGTQIFFTPYKVETDQCDGTSVFSFFSTLIINGTLRAEGDPEDPIVFQGTRLDFDYQENPAQWRGLRYTQSSSDNILKHCIVKNAIIGVEVDSVSFGNSPRLLIQQSEIRNMSTIGILGLGFSRDGPGNIPSLVVENSIIHNCGRTVALSGGGNMAFYNCTLDNSAFPGRRDPQIFINNYAQFGENLFIYPTQFRMVNTVVWSSGRNTSEVELDQLDGQPYTPDEILFDHSLIKYSPDDEIDISIYLQNSVLNEDPLFEDAFEGNYRIQEESPLIDAGKDLSARYLLDFRGSIDSLRLLPFDIGAFEYLPQ